MKTQQPGLSLEARPGPAAEAASCQGEIIRVMAERDNLNLVI